VGEALGDRARGRSTRASCTMRKLSEDRCPLECTHERCIGFSRFHSPWARERAPRRFIKEEVLKKVRSLRPNPSMVVAFIALVVASGGTAVAATLITSKQVKDGTIQLVDISKAAKASLKGNAGASGAPGAAGAQGPQGPQGIAGPAGPVNVLYQDGAPVVGTASTDELLEATATCPAGQVAIGGGTITSAGIDVPNGTMKVQEEGPVPSAAGGKNDTWFVVIHDTNGDATGAAVAIVTAICTTATNATVGRAAGARAAVSQKLGALRVR
jgi:hypothetical protein